MNINYSKQDKFMKYATYFCLAFAFVSTFLYMIYTIVSSGSVFHYISSILSVCISVGFTFFYIRTSLYLDSTNHKLFRIYIIVAAVLLSFYSLFQIFTSSGIIKFGKQDTVLDFYGKEITEVVAWADERDILVEQVYEYSDTLEQYKILSQDIEVGTLIKNIKKIKVSVSDGPNPEKEAIIPDMTGWNLDKVIKYIDDNYLTNVKISFQFHDSIKKDLIFYQDVKNSIKRNEEVNLKCSLGKYVDLKNLKMDNLVGMDTFHAILFLERNALTYSIQYVYSEEVEEGIVLKQSVNNWDVVDPKNHSTIIITVAKKSEISIPDLKKFSATEITKWATQNKIKVSFKEEYDDTIKKGKVISYEPIKDTVVNVGDTISVIISKGAIYMPRFTDIDSFKKWANENDVFYDIDYQFSNGVKSGSLISSSHKQGQIIKNSDTIQLVISQGGSTIIPNLVGMSKDEATSSCSKSNIICKFEGDGKVSKQSMRAGSNVPINTTINVTLTK